MNARSILTRALPLLVAGCLTSIGCDSGDKAKDAKADAKKDTKADAKTDAKEEAKADDGADANADDGADAKADDGADDTAGADTKADDAGGETGAPAADGGDDAKADDGGEANADDGGEAKADDGGGDKDPKAGDKKDPKAGDKKDPKAGDKKDPKEPAGPKIDAKPLYMAKCKSCHGVKGDADTKLGKKHKVEDWTKPGWKAKWSKAKVIEVITNGESGTKMKPFKDKLSKEEIEAVAVYSRKLGK